ncbi:hypothetical protein BHE74_00025204 [Ensete ventricosum]|nr:hypothetical protein BHE74_00025204 [Ensete ventricosum]
MNSGTNLGDLAERANSGTNLGDSAEKVNSSANLGNLAERVNSSANLGNLAKRANSSTNLGDLAERVNSDTNLGDLVERVNSGTNLGDLAERVNSGINLGDSTEKVNLGVNLGNLAKSELGREPEASSSGASSGPLSLVNVRVLRDLEVMKVGHDLNTAVTKGSLATIRERYSIPTEYGLHGADRMDLSDLRGMPRVSRGQTPAARSSAPTREVREVPPTEAPRSSSKRPSDASIPPDNPAQRHKKVKILSRRHKSRHGEGGSRSHSKGKEPAMSVEEPEGQAESLDEAGMSIFVRPKSMKDMCSTKSDHAAAEEFERGLLHPQLARELYTLSSEVLLAQAAKEMVLRVAELERELARTQQERTEALHRLEASDKELNEVRGDYLKPESTEGAELPKQAINDYKGSTGFKEGLKRMGRVAYEYGHRVALARFRSSHPDSEVKEDPFTIRPEDDLVPMERQQAFNDSDPPKS